jgi:hypothetical protein
MTIPLISEKPKVAIRAVGGDDVKSDTVYGCLIPMLGQTQHARYDFRGVNGTWEAIAHNQIFWDAVHQPRDAAPDYILLVDGDGMFPPNSLDRLLAHRVDIVGATYRRRKYPFRMLEYPLVEGASITISGRKGIHEWAAMPAGLLLIDIRVPRAMKYPWFYSEYGETPEALTTPDVVFGRDARAKGFKIFCDYDLSREVAHIGSVPVPFDLAQ